MGNQPVNEVVEDRALAQGSRHAEEALDEAAALLAVRAERPLALQHRRTQRPLGRPIMSQADSRAASGRR